MTALPLAQANQLARFALEQAADRSMQIAIAVVDCGGWPIVQMRMDDAFPAAVDAALAKARTAALYRRPSSNFSERVKQGIPLGALPHVLPLGGGVLLKIEGKMVGAMGMSGATEDTETALAESVALRFAKQDITR